MNWIFYAFLGAAILHIVEEYVYPGGFPEFMKKMAPPFANFAVAINGLFLVLCILAAWIGPREAVFGLSIAALCGFNGVAHLLGSVRAGRYAPGLLTGVFLYLPLAVAAYFLFTRSGQLSLWQGVASALLGLAYHAMPLGYLGLAHGLKGTLK